MRTAKILLLKCREHRGRGVTLQTLCASDLTACEDCGKIITDRLDIFKDTRKELKIEPKYEIVPAPKSKSWFQELKDLWNLMKM